MSMRLPEGGRLIDRSRPLRFRFDGRQFQGLAGDTLASALLANGQLLMGRSFKYHRPRSVLASGVEEPNALFGVGEGAFHTPNQPATTLPLEEGLSAESQNRWPSLGWDVGALNNAVSPLFPAGFYYKTFMAPRRAWEKLFEPIIRRAAGLGTPPREADPERYEHIHLHVDLLIAGGGIAGLRAARIAADSGLRVVLAEQRHFWGGRAPGDGAEINGKPADAWINETLQVLEEKENVTLLSDCTVSGVYDHGHVLMEQRLGGAGGQGGKAGRLRARLWKLRARRIITATGALERPLAFAGNDVPGVMLAGAVRDYLENWAVAVGRKVAIVTNNDSAYLTALALARAGIEVPAVLDARAQAEGPLAEEARARGIRVLTGRAVAAVKGGRRVKAVQVCRQDGSGEVLESIACDALAMSGGFSPVVHLWSHCGGKLLWDETQAHFRPDPARPPRGADGEGMVIAAGSAAGPLGSAEVLADAERAALRALDELGARRPARIGKAEAAPEPQAPPLPVWVMPERAPDRARGKMWLDFQNDVKVSDIELAAREGYESVEHTKRYTTVGMATDQGKLSNINALGVLSGALGAPPPEVGTTTFRPPYTPLGIGTVSGEARGDLFQPVRKSPIHEWHAANGADWEPVGQWRRPHCYRRPGESRAEAVIREVRNTRNALGLLDGSTLGKILVRGPDAGRFLDMLYTNMMSTLPVGRCRYGLMCNENGFLMDDGVVVRLDEESWLCHTTTGGAEHVHGWMESWLQCEWWTWKVFTANLTEQYAQIAVVGPHARKLLERLTSADLSAEALPFMHFTEAEVASIPARIYRISFSGELSFEIAVPAGQGLALWEALMEAGEDLGIMPYGTEALHVLRAEKGFIMIGDETDGTVIPQDLGLGWAISKKKADFLGKRGQMRPEMQRPDRWRLVGLETLDGSVLPECAYAMGEGENAFGQKRAIGRVTSSYYSPTLDRGIALGLVERGPERMGEVLLFPANDGTSSVIPARICDPVFYDPKGEKQNV